MSEEKSLKQYAKEAKKRLKSSFWQDYKDRLSSEEYKAERDGVSPSKVKEYLKSKVEIQIKGVKEEDELFYLKVKEILSTYGEVGNAIGLLTDKEYFNTLSYEQRQRYILDLSSKYVKAKERYYRELKFENTI